MDQQNTRNGGFFINRIQSAWKEVNFVGVGHLRNYLFSRKSQSARTLVSTAEVAAATLLKVASHPPQLNPPTIRSINARRRPLCLSCWGVYALHVTVVNLLSFLSPFLFHSHLTDNNESLKLRPTVRIGPRDLFNNVIFVLQIFD